MIADWIKEWAIPLSAGATFLLAIAAFWNITRDKIGGKVGLYHSMTIYDEAHYEKGVSVIFINRGKQKIKLDTIGFQSSNGTMGFLKKVLKKIGLEGPRVTRGFLNAKEFGLPKWVEPGDKFIMSFAQQHIENIRKKPKNETDALKYIYVGDATDNYYFMKIPNSMRKELFG